MRRWPMAETRQLRTGLATEIETGVAIIRDADTNDAYQPQFLASELFSLSLMKTIVANLDCYLSLRRRRLWIIIF